MSRWSSYSDAVWAPRRRQRISTRLCVGTKFLEVVRPLDFFLNTVYSATVNWDYFTWTRKIEDWNPFWFRDQYRRLGSRSCPWSWRTASTHTRTAAIESHQEDMNRPLIERRDIQINHPCRAIGATTVELRTLHSDREDVEPISMNLEVPSGLQLSMVNRVVSRLCWGTD